MCCGILCGILYALILKKTTFKGEPVPFVMELPNYRLPSAKSVGQLIWEKAKGFYPESIYDYFCWQPLIVWFLQNFDAGLNLVTSHGSESSGNNRKYRGTTFCTAGLWRLESIHRIDHGLYGKRECGVYADSPSGRKYGIASDFIYTVYCLRIFDLYLALYTLCVAAIATVRREMGTVRAAAGIVAVQCATAWIVAFAVHGVGMMLGL